MNIKRGLKRFWIVVSVLWVVLISDMISRPRSFSMTQESVLSLGVGGLLVWWGLLYTGFWISSGFSSDKKKDETNE